jgi:uncharacterized protein YjiK
MTTHSFTTPRRTFALSFVVLALLLPITARIHGAVPLSDHFPKVTGQETGDYLQDDADGGAGSGITYWRARDTYLVIDNNNLRIIETNRPGASNFRRIISLSGFTDPEEIHWIGPGDNTFVISQEYRNNTDPTPDWPDEIVVLTIPPGPDNITVTIGSAIRRLQFPQGLGAGQGNNVGIEAVAFLNNLFYFTTESPTVTGNPPVTTWNVWTVPNEGTGIINVDAAGGPERAVAFSIVGINTPTARARDISGMATDGTYLWLLSHEGTFIGPGLGKGRVLKMTTIGDEIADYTMPPFTSTWNQAEGIELFNDSDGLTKILLTGEKGDGTGNTGVDFMTLRSTRSTITITANDALAGEPEGAITYPGQFTVTRDDNHHLIPLDVTVSTAASTATANQDYTSIGGTVQIPQGALSQTINVTPLDDNLYEKDETVVAALTTDLEYTVHSLNHTATVAIQSVFELAGATYVYAVNDNGQAVTDAGRHNADGSLAQTYTFAVYGINNAGDVVGNGYARIGGVTHSLGLLDGAPTVGVAINSRKSIAGHNNYSSCNWTYSGGTLSGPYLISDGPYADIDDWFYNIAYSTDYDVMFGGYSGNAYAYHPYCSWPDLLPPAISYGQFPQGINKLGTVVGWEIDPGTFRDVGVMYHPCYYDSSYTTILDQLPDGASQDASIYPRKINSSDLIVGDIEGHACLRGYYVGGQWHYLDNIIGDSSWTFSAAYDISDAGHIVGCGVHSGQSRCFLIRR